MAPKAEEVFLGGLKRQCVKEMELMKMPNKKGVYVCDIKHGRRGGAL